jgi:hypothetical protein
MSATEVQQTGTRLATSSYRAAVVHDFTEPLRVRVPSAGRRRGDG